MYPDVVFPALNDGWLFIMTYDAEEQYCRCYFSPHLPILFIKSLGLDGCLRQYPSIASIDRQI